MTGMDWTVYLTLSIGRHVKFDARASDAALLVGKPSRVQLCVFGRHVCKVLLLRLHRSIENDAVLFGHFRACIH